LSDGMQWTSVAFFDPSRGGSVEFFLYMFWTYGHPAVYLPFVPAYLHHNAKVSGISDVELLVGGCRLCPAGTGRNANWTAPLSTSVHNFG